MEKPVTVLPEPDSPTSPRTCPASTAEADVVHRLDDAGLGEEMSLQILDGEDGHGDYFCSLGFNTSRNWSPTKLMLTIVISSAMPGKRLIQYLPDRDA